MAVSTFRYESMQEPRTALRLRIREIAQTRVRYGYRKIRVLLNREGWKVGKKLVYRLYREEGLALRHKPRRKRRAAMVQFSELRQHNDFFTKQNAKVMSQTMGLLRQGSYQTTESLDHRFCGHSSAGRMTPRIASRSDSSDELDRLVLSERHPLLQFNTKKKKVTISAGGFLDYEAGTQFFERRYKRGS